jgi:hypothetical protein
MVFVDGGGWCPWALERAGFKRWNVMAFGPRSAIERFFSLLDHRYRRFWERFPYRTARRSLTVRAEAFAGLQNIRKELS